jgi:glycine/D-amino acid oxidase-like deaminating enzyme
MENENSQINTELEAVPLSYWQETAPQIELSTDLPATSDVAVLGGGILGAATCYWLGRAGIPTVLIERTMLADGATGRNGGIVSSGPAESYLAAVARLGHDIVQQVLTLTLENQALLRQIVSEEEIACNYREPGHITLALSSHEMEQFAQSVVALQAVSVPIRMLERQEVQQRIATPLGQAIVGGKFTSGVALVHSARLVHGLASAAQCRGAHICRATALRISPASESVLIETTCGTLHAGAVVVAVNAWTSELVPSMARLITPVRGQMLSYAPTLPLFTTSMAAHVTSTDEYWQQAVDGAIVLGGCRAVAAGFDVGIRESQPTPKVQMALEQVLPQLFPAIGRLQVAHRWAGLMAFTADYLPIVDRIPDIANAWFAGGFSGHGMPFGIRMGQLLAETVIKGKLPLALKPFGLHRPSLA